MTVGLAATLLVGMVGGAIDYAQLVSQRSPLQAAVNAGAMAGGNALKLVVSNTDSIVGLTTQTIRTEAGAGPASPVTIDVDVARDKTSVTARAEQTVKLMFGPFTGMRTMVISARAKASLVGKMRLCMLALDPEAKGAFSLQNDGQVTAYGCALYSNSLDPQGMAGLDNAQARAETICSAGGFLNARVNFLPNPQTGCPVIGDCIKLPGTKHPSDHGTPETRITNVVRDPVTLNPGTYCKGLYITDTAAVTFDPGIYVFRDGPLIVDGYASSRGMDVGFYFTGDNGRLLFDKGTTITLAAPTGGPMAGVLMSEVPSVANPVDPVQHISHPHRHFVTPTPRPMASTKPRRIYRIISDNARSMLGTIYLPAGRLVIDAMQPVSDRSAYTVVVAQQINLYKGPNLYLNTQYSGSNVPVPDGVGPRSGRLLLTQ